MVRPRLFFSPQQAAMNEEALSKAGITHVLSLIGKPTRMIPEIRYGWMKIDDIPEQPIIGTSITAEKWIRNALEQPDTKVLVYCRMGRSRSASIVMAYLILEEGLSYEQALAAVRKNNPEAQPNPGFVRQLKNIVIIAKRTRELCKS
jgi:atypical dual specificity phosphatase